MSNLIVGASGNIGIYLIKKKKNWIYTYNRKKINGGIKFDLTEDDISKIIDKYKIKSVAFLSSNSDPNYCFKYKIISRNINVKKTIKILNYLIKKKIYFIFFSSEFIFNGKKGSYKENDKKNPVNEYGKQKLEVENYILKNAKSFSIFRIAKTYSSELNDRTLISDFLQRLLKGERNFSAADDQIFSPLYVGDLSRIVNIFLKKKIYGVYNVCGPEKFSRYEILNIVKKKLRKKLRKNIIIRRKKLNNFKFLDKRPLNVSMRNNKIQKKLNFKMSKFNDISKKVIIKSKINEKVT